MKNIEIKESIEKIIGTAFSGVISVKKDNEIIFNHAYGFADKANKRKNKVDTRFATASAGKAFVAVAIMKLIEEEKISLESKLGDLVDFDLKRISKEITIRQLLNHTSGIPDYFNEEVMENYADLWVEIPSYGIRTSNDMIKMFSDLPMMYEPGLKFHYNNTGYVVLGIIIEKVTGISFDAYLDKIIFTPCKMIGTGYYELDRLPENCANSYILDEKTKEYYTNIYSVCAKGIGDGGAFTTLADIEKFWESLFKGEILKKETVSEMISSKIDEGYYGYGFWIRNLDDGTNFPYFQGEDPGVSFVSSYNNGLIISAVSNFCDDVWRIRREIDELLK